MKLIETVVQPNPSVASPVKRPVAIFAGKLLPASETFIKAQADGLTEFAPFFLGTRHVDGLSLPANRSFVANRGDLWGKWQEYVFKQFGHSKRLRAAQRAYHPGLIHAHFGVCGALALPLARATRTPLIVTFHGLDACMSDDYARRDSLSTRVYLQRREQLKQQTHTFIAVSEFIRQKLLTQGFPDSKIRVHYIGIDTDRFQADPSIDREPVVLFVGRLTEKKGCEFLIRAMTQVQGHYPEAQLVVIGDGTLRPELEALAQTHLTNYQFLGRQSSDQVREWMNKAYVLAAPSVTTAIGDSEGLPMVILEALAMGLPVVSTYHAGIPEAVVPQKTGLLSAERDVSGLADSLMQLLKQPDLWQQMHQQGPQQVRDRFDLSDQVRRLESIYSEVYSPCTS